MLILNNLPFSRVDWLAWNAETKEVGARGLQSKSDLYNLQPILANYFFQSQQLHTFRNCYFFTLYFQFAIKVRPLLSYWGISPLDALLPGLDPSPWCLTARFLVLDLFLFTTIPQTRFNVQFRKTMSIVICEHNVKDDNLNPRTLYPLKGGCQILFGLFVLPKSGRIGDTPRPPPFTDVFLGPS